MSEGTVDLEAVAEGVKTEVLGLASSLLDGVVNDVSADGMVTMIAEVSKGAVLSGKPELVEAMRAALPWLGTYHKVTAGRAVLETFVSVAGSLVRAGLLGLSRAIPEAGSK